MGLYENSAVATARRIPCQALSGHRFFRSAGLMTPGKKITLFHEIAQRREPADRDFVRIRAVLLDGPMHS